MSQDTELTATLDARIFAVDDIPPETNRAGENDDFEADVRFEDYEWMRVTHRFGVETLLTLPARGGRLLKQGFTQVDFFVPPKTGRARLDALADAMRDAFPAQLDLVMNGLALKIVSSRRWGGEPNGKWWWDHVDIYWTLRARNP